MLSRLRFAILDQVMKINYLCTQAIVISDETRQNQKGDCHQKKLMEIHDIPFAYFSERFSNRKYITAYRNVILFFSRSKGQHRKLMKCISAELAAPHSEADVNALHRMGCVRNCSIEGSHRV